MEKLTSERCNGIKRGYMIWTDGSIYRCVSLTGTNFSPDGYPDGWEKYTT